MIKELHHPAIPGKRFNLRRIFDHRGATLAALAATATVGYLGWLQIVSNLLLVMVLTSVVLYEFVRRVDQGMPLMQIGALLACLQWLVGPMISFLSSSHHDRYFMYVPEDYYFSYALPGTAAYVLGLLGAGVSIRQRPALHRLDRSQFVSVGIALNLVAFGAEFSAKFLPGGLAFFFHLLSQMRYVGALYFMLSDHRWKWHLVALSCVQLFWDSAESGMFHDLILWSTLLFTFWFAMQRRDAIRKVLIVILALISVTVVQLVKQSMREKQRLGQPATFSGELIGLVAGHSSAYSESALTLATARLNQGWIISAIMANVPRFEPYCDGETVQEAVVSAVVPRVVAGEKKKAGGQENFRRFTGLPLEDSTSMGISPLGEAFANFGSGGGILFMAVMGVTLSTSFLLLSRRILKHPTFLFWIPLVYYQAIKAETELVVVFNQITKGAIVALGGYWICAHYLIKGPAHTEEETLEANKLPG